MGKKQKGFRKELIMPLFIAFIMVMSVFGYMWGSSRTKLSYNGFKFYQLENNNFMLKIDTQRLVFSYFPSELEWINYSKGIAELFNTPMVYFTYAPNSTRAESIAQAQFNFAQMMDETKGVYVQNAFISETEYDIPVITCDDATQSVPVISIEDANTTEILVDDSCIIVKTKNEQELFAAYERLLYSILGVMG